MILTLSTEKTPKVAILLCTYQGQDHLAEQLDSFAAQTHLKWGVWASDDGSRDKTLAILETYKQKWGETRLTTHIGPAKGFAANFLSLIHNPSIDADYYAYADQDDIWEPDKLAIALQWLETVPKDTPALYCARTKLVNINNQEIGLSPLFSKPPSFANALTQNIGGGNTMVLNNRARDLLLQVGQDTAIVTHDWWTYLVVTGCGGFVFYDSNPTLRYRQHSNNLIGMNVGWRARLTRICMLWQGRYQQWNNTNIAALNQIRHMLTPQNRDIFQKFLKSRKMKLIPRLIQLKKAGIYRQTLLGNLGLIAAAIFNKV